MSRTTKTGLLNELEQSINPATEDKQLDVNVEAKEIFNGFLSQAY